MANRACDNQKTIAERIHDAPMPIYDLYMATGIPVLVLWKMMNGWVIPTAAEREKIEDALKGGKDEIRR